MSETVHAGAPGKTSVHLLDSATGRTIHSWKFDRQDVIRIGRSDDNHIVITDPSVSRFHAELRYEGAHWSVVNIGRNGVLVGGRSVPDARVEDQMTFRLGAAGPRLRFDSCDAAFEGMNTITGGAPIVGPAVRIDEAQRNLQVQEIAESDYFQQLQRASRQLRQQAGAKPAPDR